MTRERLDAMGAPTHIPVSLIHALRSARKVAVLTGAGISAESGVPTFRDAQTGLWARYRPEDLATPEAFRRDPTLVWNWYAWRRRLVASVAPNAGHLGLVELERRVPEFRLVTQNVDGLHERAGNRHLVELHGNLFRIKCAREGITANDWQNDPESPPRCSRCGGFLRPDVVWFGEALPLDALAQADVAAEQCDVFFTIGTSALVYPAADLPLAALRRGATVVEINPQPTPLSERVSVVLRGPAGEVLPRLLRETWGSME